MRATRVFQTLTSIIAETLVLIAVGAILGALTGTACLVLLGVPSIGEWSLHELGKMVLWGTLVGAPLGALGAPVLGWLLLRHVPVKRSLLYAPLGTLVGSLLALLVGWLRADIADGVGLFYLVGGGVVGVVLAAVGLRLRYRADAAVSSFTTW